MSRPKTTRRLPKLLEHTHIATEDENAIDEAEYMLRQLALAGKLREHSGTLRQRYVMWRSCFDIVMVPRAEGIPRDHFILSFDCGGIEAASSDAIRPGDVDAVMRYTLMTLLRMNSLILLPVAEAENMRRKDLVGFYRLSDEKTATVLKKARGGDPVAFELLKDMLRQYQDREGGEAGIPKVLRSFRDLLLEGRIAYRPPVGMTKSQTQRDFELLKVMYHLRLKGYSPTRDKSGPTMQPSGAFIVEQALKRLGIDLTAKQLERRWSAAITRGDIRKEGRFGYRLSDPLSEMMPLLRGMEVVTTLGNTIYPIVTADADHISRLLDWSESIAPNDPSSQRILDVPQEVAASLRSAIGAVQRLERYGAQISAAQEKRASLEAAGAAAAPTIADLEQEMAALDAAIKQEADQLAREFPLFARMRESTIPDLMEDAGTDGAFECARLLLDAMTEVRNEATGKDPRQ